MLPMIAALLAVGAASASELDAEYRPDIFLPRSEYDEPTPTPTGCRIFVTGIAQASGLMSDVYINNQLINMSVSGNETLWPVDFVHVWPATLTAGEAAFAVFHTRQPQWHTIPTATIRVTDAGGRALFNGTFHINRKPPARIMLLTLADNASTVIAHVRSNSSSPVTISSVELNGQPTTPVRPPAPLPAIPPGETLMLEMRVADPPMALTSAITLRLSMSDGSVVVAGARPLREFFPVETWPKSSECPYPTVNDTNYRIHRDHGVDTFFTTDGSTIKCANAMSEAQIINELAPAHDFWVLGGKLDDADAVINDTSRLAGWFLGDEDDNHATVTYDLRKNAIDSRRLWSQFPGVPTYVGGSRNRFRGAWGNSVDALGMDAYIAACAPHVTQWGLPQNPRFAFDYLRITRENQAPWPTWLYSQAFDDGWNADILGYKVVRQPDPAELAVQLQSVVAAGAKGLMLFQTEISLMPEVPASWAKLGTMAREIGAARELYREGDVAGPVTTDAGSDVIAELIQARRALVLVLVNLKNDGGYTDLSCAVGGDDHWDFVNQTVTASFAVPPGWGEGYTTFEIAGGAVMNPTVPIKMTPRPGTTPTVAVGPVPLGSAPPTSTRTIVFASDTSLRDEIEAALKPARRG